MSRGLANGIFLFGWMRLCASSGTPLADDVENLIAQATDMIIVLELGLGPLYHREAGCVVVHEQVKRIEPFVLARSEDAASIAAAIVIDGPTAGHDGSAAARIFDPLGIGFHQVEVDRDEGTDADVPFAGREILEEGGVIGDRRGGRHLIAEAPESVGDRNGAEE